MFGYWLVVLRGIFADVTPTTSLPDWIPPSVLVIIGLAVAAGYLNQKGVWVSGREMVARLTAQTDGHTAELRAKDATIALLTSELGKANGRWKDERDQRVGDAQAMGQLKQAAAYARGAMTDVAEGLSHDGLDGAANPYVQRSAPKRGSKSASR